MAATTALRVALNQGTSSGNLVDTKIILYSHRDSSGQLCRPKALYSNSHVLKTVPYFGDLLSRKVAEVQPKDFSGVITDDGISTEDYGYLSDSDLEDDEDEKIFPPKHASKSIVHPFDPFGIPGEDRRISYEEHQEHAEKVKVVRIPDMAFVTFQAFLMYLYTNTMEFAPFGSKENRRSRSAEFATPSDDNVPRPSPKSIYRLADKYGVPALRALALDRIRGELVKCDIVEQSFSRFASRYDEIRSLWINRLASAWMEDSTTEMTRASVGKKIDSSIEGDLGHTMDMLSALWEIANNDGGAGTPSNISPVSPILPHPPYDAGALSARNQAAETGAKGKKKKKGKNVTNPVHATGMVLPLQETANKKGRIRAPSNTSFATGQVTSPARWASVKIALIRSIRNGVFFDRKYWARNSKAGDVLKPVYFSSIIMDDKAQQLNNLVKYLKGPDILVNDLAGGVNVDSDCEGVPTGTGGGNSKEESRAVLITGSFSAWKSLFFYRCTNAILFAPLKSQGVESRLSHIRAKTVAVTPPPCSPKTIYVLASLLEIQPLRNSAFADIKHKVTSDNVVDEVFSWVTASQEKLMEMQCELMISKFRDPKTIALVKEKIGHISDGSSSYCAGALKLGLKKAFELKNQNR